MKVFFCNKFTYTIFVNPNNIDPLYLIHQWRVPSPYQLFILLMKQIRWISLRLVSYSVPRWLPRMIFFLSPPLWIQLLSMRPRRVDITSRREFWLQARIGRNSDASLVLLGYQCCLDAVLWAEIAPAKAAVWMLNRKLWETRTWKHPREKLWAYKDRNHC